MRPRVDSRGLHLGLAHAPGMTVVSLDCDAAVPGGRSLALDGVGEWRLSLPLPAVHRLEYRFEVTRGRRVRRILDPDNPCLVAGVAGPWSVVELPGYAAPCWLLTPAAGRYETMTVVGSTPDRVPVTVWSPPSLARDDPGGLLLVHDGPAYDVHGSITRFVTDGMERGLLPPLRLALLHPVRREDWYSGSPAYLETVTGPVLDRLIERYAVQSPVAVMGASLGGLTALLAGITDSLRAEGSRIGAVFAQSGSFFTTRTDPQERRFPYFDRVVASVAAVRTRPAGRRPLVIGLTCGALEENALNNRSMAEALRRTGHTVTYREVADLHTYTAWRDSLAPTLIEVLTAVWDRGDGQLSPRTAADH
jgi:enterochelin esterase-like enzyme